MTDNINNNSLPSGGHLNTTKKLPKGALIAIVCALGLVLLLLAASIFGVYMYSGIYKGVSVGGIDCSGMSRKAALSELQNRVLTAPPPSTIQISISDKSFNFLPSSFNIRPDITRMAESAYLYGRSGSFFTRLSAILKAFTSGVQIDPIMMLDDTALTSELETASRALAQELAQPAYEIKDDKLILDRGQSGIFIDIKELSAFVKDRMLKSEYGDTEFTPSVSSPDAVDILMIKSHVDAAPQNPSLDLKADPSGKTVSPAVRGVALDVKKAQEALDATTERFVEIPLDITEPSMSTEQFKAKLFADVLGSGSSPYNSSLAGRTTNVKLAASFCNDVILNPGDEFSYNGAVGPRTYARGFKDAIVYVGATAEDGVGGGICQVSSTLYYAALRADMKISERYAHSRTVVYVPLGEDATVVYGNKDFKFVNNTDYPLKVRAYTKNSTLYIELLGTKTQNKTVEMETKIHSKTPFETKTVVNTELPLGTKKVKSSGYTGYSTETWRVVYIDGREVSRALENKSKYTKYDKVIEENPLPAVKPITPPPTEDTGTDTDTEVGDTGDTGDIGDTAPWEELPPAGDAGSENTENSPETP